MNRAVAFCRGMLTLLMLAAILETAGGVLTLANSKTVFVEIEGLILIALGILTLSVGAGAGLIANTVRAEQAKARRGESP